MEQIRVLECIRQGSIGGGERHVIELSASLDKTKFIPIVLSFTEGPMIDALKELGIKSYVIPTVKAFNFTVWRKVRDLIIKEKIDIVHAHGTKANSNVFWAAKTTGKPLVYTIHGWSFHPDQSLPRMKVMELIEKFLTNQANQNISVSMSNQSDGITRFKMPRSTVIYYGINRDDFYLTRNFKDIRSEFKIPADCIVVLYMVRITIQKDPFTMLKAFKSVIEKVSNILLLVVGDGDLKEKSEKLAMDLGIMDHVRFISFRQDVPDFLYAADIYCLPSLWEGLPLGLLEAMFMKKAIISTPVDGNKEVIEDHYNGLLVPAQDPVKLSKAILELAQDKELRNTLADNAQKTVEKTSKDRFSIPKMTKEVESVYLKLYKPPVAE